MHSGLKTSHLLVIHFIYKIRKSLPCLALPGKRACNRSLSAAPRYIDCFDLLRIVGRRNLGRIRPQYMLLGTDSLDLEVVDTSYIRPHTLSICCPEGLGTSFHPD